MFRIFAITQYERASFQWVTIPELVEVSAEEIFDPLYMRALYDVGYATALRGPVWSTSPPGFPAAGEPGELQGP